jgi:hypothetical protein
LINTTLQDFLSFPALGAHVSIALARMRLGAIFVHGNERIWVVGLKISHGVVDFAVLGLIGTDIVKKIFHGPLAFGHLPVSDGDLGRFEIVPQRQLALLHLLDGMSVSLASLLFEVAHKSMADFGIHNIGQEEPVAENTLCPEDHQLHKQARLGHLQEGEKVHSLVVGIVE